MTIQDLGLIAKKYTKSPDILKDIETSLLDEYWKILSSELPPVTAFRLTFSNPTPRQELEDLFAGIEGEILRRGEMPKSDLPGTDLPRLEKVYLAEGTKTNVMRIIDALYELKYFRDSNNLALTRDKIFSSFGELFAGGLNDFAQALNQAYDKTSEDANTAIFDTMKEKVLKKINQTQERAKKK
jgi:hypothetical protein